MTLLKQNFQVPFGWRWDGDWYVSPEIRYKRIFILNTLLIVLDNILVHGMPIMLAIENSLKKFMNRNIV